MEQIKARDLNDYAGFVPGLSFSSTGPSTNLLVIRGITTGSQLSSATGVYLDDIPLGASTSNGVGYQSLNINAFDLNRIEVLNGPQGTLYGATSLGGTIKYIPNSPTLKSFGVDAGVEVSSTEHGGINHAYTGMVNLPIADIAAIRIDGYQVYDSGYAKDPIYGRDNQGWARSEGGRVALLVKPTDDLDIQLRASTQHIPSESADVGFRDPKTHEPTYGTYDQAYPTFQPSDYSLTLYSAAINYDTPWAKFSSITGLQVNNGTSYTDNSLTYDAALALFGAGGDPWSLYVNTTTKKFTQEFRVASHESTVFQWLAGAFLSNEKTSEVVDLFDYANPGGTLFRHLALHELPAQHLPRICGLCGRHDLLHQAIGTGIGSALQPAKAGLRGNRERLACNGFRRGLDAAGGDVGSKRDDLPHQSEVSHHRRRDGVCPRGERVSTRRPQLRALSRSRQSHLQSGPAVEL